MRIAFYSTLDAFPWGGSEELWSRTAHALLGRGHQVFANVRKWSPLPEPIGRLIDAGLDVCWHRKPIIGRGLRHALQKAKIGRYRQLRWLRQTRPDFVLNSAGYHTDDPVVANSCRKLGIRYGILVQAAGTNLWIRGREWQATRDAYQRADRIYLLSQENRQILESNLALDLSRAEIVDNPFNVPVEAAPDWPANTEPWRLACVARLQFLSKGQDLLLHVLRSEKWRSRRLQITFFGHDGGSERSARQIVDSYGLHEQVRFGGFAQDIVALWSQHHGLVLPSRYEGNPLAMTEAMLCGRVPIVTKMGRVADLIEDNFHGFVAAAPTVELLDDALERAWQRRSEWQGMGARAAAAIRSRHSLQPAEDFADRLLAAAPPASHVRARAA